MQINIVVRNILIVWVVLSILVIFGATSGYAQSAAGEEQDPFKVSVAYTGDFFSNISGGIDSGLRYMDNIDINLEIDFGNLPLGLEGTTFYVYGLGNQGGSISELTGDLQGVSNIEGDNSWRFFEIWAQKKFFLANTSILVGLYDINSEFNVLNSSLLFINGSHGLDPTLGLSGVLGPSTFPHTSMGGRLKINPFGGWVIQTAVLDGIPSNPANPTGTKVFWRKQDGLIMLAEVALHSVNTGDLQRRNRTVRLQRLLDREATENRQFKIAIGGWMYTKKRDGWQDPNQRDMGVYGMGEIKIYSESGSYQGLTLFGRAGIANEEINRLAGYIGGGVTYTGLLPGRNDDQAGIAVAHAINSSDFKIQNTNLKAPAETNLEFTYLTDLTESVQLQGDVQYIINPGINSEIDYSVSAGLRLLLSF